MRPPSRYSAAPLHSFVTVPTHRVPSFAETVRAIWSWFRGRKPTTRERQLEEKLIERLAAEMAEDDERNGKGGR